MSADVRLARQRSGGSAPDITATPLDLSGLGHPRATRAVPEATAACGPGLLLVTVAEREAVVGTLAGYLTSWARRRGGTVSTRVSGWCSTAGASICRPSSQRASDVGLSSRSSVLFRHRFVTTAAVRRPWL